MLLPPRSPRAALVGLAALVSLALAACGGDSTTEPASDVTLTLTIVASGPLELRVGQNSALTTKVTASDGSTPTGLPITEWLSRNPTIAGVTAAGVVRGSSVGQTFVVAELSTSKGVVRDSLRVDVRPAGAPQ